MTIDDRWHCHVNSLPWRISVVYRPHFPVARIYLVMTESIASVLLALIFSLNHNPLPTLSEQCYGFYEHQVRTSRNYKGGLPMHLFSGHLSLQIEHHVVRIHLALSKVATTQIASHPAHRGRYLCISWDTI